MTKREYKTLSKRVKLLLNKEEGYDVEFKESLNGLDANALVAFANADKGGTILVGVKENKTKEGRQCGNVVGCKVGDKEKLAIISKAESCVPPVELEVIIENSQSCPFYRIEIPAGDKKPYCTSSGTYKIRGDGRTNALLPGRMFVEAESQQFLSRFREATRALEQNLDKTKAHIVAEMEQLLMSLREMEIGAEESFGHIKSIASSAANNSEEALVFSDESANLAGELNEKLIGVKIDLSDIDERVKALLEHFGLEDPPTTSRQQILEALEALRK